MRGTGLLVPPANTCQATFNKYKPEGYELRHARYDARERVCTIDYLNEEMRSEISSLVDCNSRCEGKAGEFDDEDSDEAQEAVGVCVNDCEEMIRSYSLGSFRVRETGEVVEANMPFTISPFLSDDEDSGERVLAAGWEQQVTEQFEAIGCRPDYDIGFRHPHEFADTTAGTEPDEDPAAFALHIRGGDRGRCMLSDVLNLVRKLEGEEPVGSKKDRYAFITEALSGQGVMDEFFGGDL